MEYIAKTTLDQIAVEESFIKETGIVYLIQNQINKKVYIGISSHSFVRRYGMRFASHNEHLNRSIEKYGLNNFMAYICFSGIEDYSELQKLEMQLISVYYANDKEYGYNKTLGGEGTLGYQFTEEDYLRIQVPVVALKKDGSLFKIYESQKQAFDELGVYITDCLKMRTKTAHDLIWIYKEEFEKMRAEDIQERVEWANNGLTQIKPILAFDRDGNFVKEFSSVIDASRELDCSCGTLTNCCKHTVKTFKSFIWFYKKEYEELSQDEIEDIIDHCNDNERGNFSKENLSIAIVALDIDTGEYVNTYASAHDAEIAIRIPDANGHIIACCKGKLVSCYGYKWCYESDYIEKTDLYYSKVRSSIKGRKSIVALDIDTGDLVHRYASINEAMKALGKQGGGSISSCCTGKLNYCYGFRWMYEDDYERDKESIHEIIAKSNEEKAKNRSKCRSIPVVIVWDGEVIIKFSIKELAEYLLTVYGIPNVRSWFKQRGLPQKFKERVSFYGTAEEYYRLKGKAQE